MLAAAERCDVDPLDPMREGHVCRDESAATRYVARLVVAGSARHIETLGEARAHRSDQLRLQFGG